MNHEETAAKLIEDHLDTASNMSELEAAIATALRVAYMDGHAAGHEAALDKHHNGAILKMLHEARMMNGIVDCTGDTAKVRKVLGTLPVMADGFVAGSGADLWWTDIKNKAHHLLVLPETVADCYSTREAAEKAKEAK